MIHIAIFASGKGSNATALCSYFQNHSHIRVTAVVSNKVDAGVRNVAEQFGLPFHYISNEAFEKGDAVVALLQQLKVEWIALAGFLRLLPEQLIQQFQNHILNIHPSLLPKYGGKGMFGIRVHRAVLEAGEITTGITIHLVNEHFDEGRVLFQKEVPVLSDDTEAELAARVLQAEHEWYPKVIEQIVLEGKK